MPFSENFAPPFTQSLIRHCLYYLWCQHCLVFDSERIFLSFGLFFNVPFVIRKVNLFSTTSFSKLILLLWIHWRLSTILKTSNKSVWSNISWYVKVYIFRKFIQNTIQWGKTQVLKKIPSDKINITKNTNVKKSTFGQNKRYKNALFLLSQAPTHHSFTFNLRFSYEMKDKVRLSKTAFEIFHFRFRFVFIEVYIFVQHHEWTLWLYNVIIPFKFKIIERPHRVLLPDLSFLSCNKKF